MKGAAAALLAMAAMASAAERARLVVLTDISSLEAGVREPDDGQSLIRLLLFSNEIDIEGLIATSNMGHGQTVRPELIRQAVAAYGKVRGNLLRHDKRYPPAERLLAVVKAGQPVGGPKVPVEGSVGEGKDTEGSEWIVRVADRADKRPVWVAIWGGSADLAQALWKVRATRGTEGLRQFAGKLRIHSIYDQDSTGAWIKANFPDLFYITRNHAIRGMYRGGDASLVGPEWVERHVKGHGALGDLYPNYDGGDIWARTLGRVRGIKEGDTPSYLNLIANGLDPLDGWGGKIEGEGKRWEDARGVPGALASDPDPRMVAVYRWRPAYQAEFQARLDWCVGSRAEANHPPEVRVAVRRAGAVMRLDAGGSRDPDGGRLEFEWSRDGAVFARGARTEIAPGEQPREVVLTVRDAGQPPLERYARVRVEPRSQNR